MRTLLPALLFLLPLLLLGQPAAIQQTYPISTTGFDAGRQVIALPDGSGYVILGERVEAANANRRDIFLHRVNFTGVQNAQGTFGLANASDIPGQGLIPTWNGWVFAGTRFSADNSNSNGLLVRTRLSGTSIASVWAKEVSIPGTSLVSFTDLDSLPDNGFIATGSATVGTQKRIIAAKFDVNGTVEWSQVYTLGTGRSIFVSSGGGNAFIAGSNKLLRIRTSSGETVWEKTLTPPAFGPATGQVSVEFNDMAAMPGKQIAVLGRIANNAAPGAVSAFHVAVWTQGGDFKWQRSYHQGPFNAANPNEGTSIIYHGSSARLIVGGIVDKKVTLSHLTNTGTLQTTYTSAAMGDQFAPAILLYNGHYAFTAGIATTATNTNTFFYRSAVNFLGLSAPPGGGGNTGNNPETAASMAIWPNPAQEMATLRIASTTGGPLRLRLLDALGRLVWEREETVFEGDNRVSIDLSNLTPGAYWVSVPGMRVVRVLKQ